ncbi:MAG TPA: glycosyltransferase family 4 protein [Candidatus Dormibacteraeota bacterium]|nr:glycosyltransferase family 4 protein [Candidatus Dormibacteraeota bacterium]
MTHLPLAFAVISMEGPDPYSQAGGLGVRVAHLSRALAAAGYPTSLFFVGDPALPAHEVRQGVDLYRLAQEVSRSYPKGIYDGEEVKRAHLAGHFPQELVHGWAAPALEAGLTPILLFEEWHTAAWTKSVSDLLWRSGVRDRCLLVWNANNQFGFDTIDWPALAYTAAVTTVSRYMRVLLQTRGIDPIVIPNGIPEAALERPNSEQVARIRRAAGGRPIVLKIGRFHPDKRWQQAIRSMALLRRAGVAVRMVARGGGEEYGRELMAEATSIGLNVSRWTGSIGDPHELARAISSAPEADVLELASFLPEALLPYLYASSVAVLANSGFEPFGLVGLETMAAGGVTVVGATGEDYARHLHNSFVVQTDDPGELAGGISRLAGDAALRSSIRRNGRSTARTYTWPEVIGSDLVPRLPILARRQMARWPVRELGT